MTFASLQLASPLLQSLDAMGYETPTPVQAKTIPAALAGGDWMVSSQTGSGKTAAFLVPALHALLTRAEPLQAPALQPKHVRKGYSRGAPSVAQPPVLVLCPTRELAQQVAQEAIELVRFARGIRIATVLGGMPYMMQLKSLEGAALVVATPGRLLDLHRNNQINLDDVDTLVVDEADRMLDLGFSEDLAAIHQATIGRKRTLMFSATFAPRIMTLAEAVMRKPRKIELATAQDAHQNIEQRLHWVSDGAHKAKLLEHYLNAPDMEQAVVFASTQIETDALSDELRAAGYRASALHGGLPQAMRNRRIKSLREGHIQILVATDVAARGIDVPAISHVINFGLPMKAEDYVHRIGRTGRAGRDGLAITLAGARDRYKVRSIEGFTRQRIAVSEVEGLAPAPMERSTQKRGWGNKRSERNEPRAASRSDDSFNETTSPSNYSGPTDTPAREAFAKRMEQQQAELAALPYAAERRPSREHRSGFGGRNERGGRGGRFESFDRNGRRERGSFNRDAQAPHEASQGFGRPAWSGRNERNERFERAEPMPQAHGERFDHAPRFERSTERSGRFTERSARARPSGFSAPRSFDQSHRANRDAAPRSNRASHPAAGREMVRPAPRPAVRTPGPALTPPHPGGSRAERRAHLRAAWEAQQAAA